MTDQVETTVVDTEAKNQPDTETVKSEKTTAPKVEQRDGKLYVDGTRVYTRDDTNKIAATARQEAERNLLTSLEVDSLDSVKEVIRQLRSTSPEGNDTLNISSLRDAVKKKEQTVEELQNQLGSLRRELVLNKHLGNLTNAMPTAWTVEQRQAVVDLMNARGMIQVEGDTFAIRNGDGFLTEDGERPDYKAAVELVGRTLGLPFGKQGVAVVNGEKLPEVSKNEAINEELLRTDAKYRAAYTAIRSYQPHLKRSQITDTMIRNKIQERSGSGPVNLSQVGLVNPQTGAPQTRRK